MAFISFHNNPYWKHQRAANEFESPIACQKPYVTQSGWCFLTKTINNDKLHVGRVRKRLLRLKKLFLGKTVKYPSLSRTGSVHSPDWRLFHPRKNIQNVFTLFQSSSRSLTIYLYIMFNRLDIHLGIVCPEADKPPPRFHVVCGAVRTAWQATTNCFRFMEWLSQPQVKVSWTCYAWWSNKLVCLNKHLNL